MLSARHAPLALLAGFLVAGCSGGAQPAEEPAPTGVERPLAAITEQRIIVAPVSAVREGDAMGWAASIPRQREWLRTLDREIAVELEARGLGTAWVYPDGLVRAYERNSALSPDPYRLATAPLRGLTRLTGQERLPEPLATQLRTLVAVHDGRFVLVPVEVSFAPAGAAGGSAVLRLVLLDARTTEIRWLGEVKTDPTPGLTPGVATSLAARFADLIVAR